VEEGGLFIMKSKGFTLIELIITIVILGVIGAFTFQFILSVLESYVTMSAGEDAAREGRLAMERMSREVRAATGIVSPLAGGSGNTITFNRTAPPISIDNSTQVAFQLTGGTLQRKRGSNTPEPLASNVSSFTVTRSSGNGELVTLDLTLSSQTTVRLRTMVYPRYFKYQ
jgi:prepilin-type N-terminal cleavage/methylation domain-containing protein